MFRDARSLLDDRKTIFKEREVHVVSFRWSEFKPILKAYEDGDIIELDLGYIDFNVGQEKTCVGSFDGGYTPCPESRRVSRFLQCQICAPPDIPRLRCIFDPGDCEGCDGGFCREEHVVYLAFHGIHSKIGMTMRERLKTRLIEQGADAYAILATVGDRIDARRSEKSLSEELNIPQRVGAKKRLKYMARKLDRDIIERKYRSVRNRVPVGKLNYLRDHPIPRPLRAEPSLRATAGIHRGKQVGLKGPFLIYENAGLQALDLTDLQGRKMRISDSYYRSD